MSESAKAVFLSYASQDVGPALRICSTLRAAGVEVWFDQDALVGGDAWDQKIRGQIGACALFMPVISANTQARQEGYFRLEWKLAAQRTHMLSERMAFLMPVVIDATRDAEADVPTEFRAVQSTKLPGGEASAAFITRVQKLLGGASAPAASSLAFSPQPSAPARAARSGLPPWVSAALGAAVVALVAFVVLRPSGKDAAPAPKPVAETIPAPAVVPAVPVSSGSTPFATDKSVAVLAFTNLSDDKANEYFSDGISEELLNVLAKVPGLKVTARTSSFYFKGKQVPIPEIAKQLGVAYVVEGSVRKSGSKVRITAQLIKAEDDFHVWSDTFTRDLKDVFAVQDEIASLIARNLRAKMALGRERPAVAPEIYALVLQARQAAARQTIEGGREAVKLYREVLALAPDEADAWAELAYVYQYLARFGGIDTGEGMREARLAARKALELDPEQPLGLAAFGWVQRTDDHDWRGALESFRHALAAAPENVTIMSDAAICFLNVGLVDESVALADRAAERDPLNPQAHWTCGIILAFSGRLAQAEAPYRRAIELAPAADEYHSHLARVLTGLNRLEEAKVLALAEPSERYRLSALAGISYHAGDTATAERLVAELIAKYSDSMAGYIAVIYAQAGHRDEAFKWLERAYENRDSAVAWVKTSCYLEGLHDDPRWPVFLHKMGLADDQLN